MADIMQSTTQPVAPVDEYEGDYFELKKNKLQEDEYAGDYFELGENRKPSPMMKSATKGFLDSLGERVVVGIGEYIAANQEVPSLFSAMRDAGSMAGKGVWEQAEATNLGVQRLAGDIAMPFFSEENQAILKEKLPDIFPPQPKLEHLRKFMAGEETLAEGETPESLMKEVAAEQVNMGPIGSFSSIAHPIVGVIAPIFNMGIEAYSERDVQEQMNHGVPESVARSNTNANVQIGLAMLNITGVGAHYAPNKAKLERLKEYTAFSEKKFLGLEKLSPEEQRVVNNATEALDETPVAPIVQAMDAVDAAPTRPMTVEEAARNVAPEVFNEFDALQTKRDTYAQWIREFSDKRRADAEMAAPHTAKIVELDAQITALQEAKKGGYGKLQSLLAKREKLQEANDLVINEAIKQDTPDLAAAREAYLKTDARMRDLAEQVTEAKRIARENLPEQETIEVPKAVEELTPEQTGAVAIEETAKVEEIKRTVAEEVEARLVEQGTAPEIAKTQAQVANSFFETFAKTYPKEGRDSFEWYSKFPTKLTEKGGDAKRGGYVRPKGGIVEGTKAIIKLAKGSDASTFMHESAHHYLDIMDWAAKQADAPVRIKDDVGTIRKWLKAEDGDFTRAQHEKFARGFERYLMEGIAPSKELAGAFAKFKQWLTDIYQTVQKLRSPISEEIRGVFDRMLAENPERIMIEPEFSPKPRMKQPELPIVKLLSDEPVYAKPMKEPPSLTDYVKKNGGIIDDTGEIKQLLDDKKLARDVIKSTGRTLDDMALKAWEDGYFPEKKNRPTVQEFLAKFGDDIRGIKQYSANDAVAVESVQASRSYNTEVDKLAAELGIDTANKTRKQFWDEVAEKQSAIEAERINTEIEDARIAAEAEADARAAEFLESRGESWEPMSEKIRSLEDLENDIRQEESAGKQQQGEGDTQEPAVSKGSEGTGAQIVRGDAGGAGLDGSTGKVKPERQRLDSNGEFVKPEPLFNPDGTVKYDTLEKRIEKLDVDVPIADFIRQAASENAGLIEQQRRGVVSNQETFNLAETMGVGFAGYDLLRERKIGKAFSATEIKLAEATFKVLSKDAFEKSKLPPTPENMAEFAKANQRFIAGTSQFLGAVAEAGRALQILKTLSIDIKQAKDIQEFFQSSVGKSAKDIAEQMDFMSKLDTPEQIAKFAQNMRKATGREMLMEYWKNSILSGMTTHAVNITSNALVSLLSVPEAYVAGAVSKIIGSKQRMYVGEGTARLVGLMESIPDAIKTAKQYFKDNTALPDKNKAIDTRVTKAIPGKVGDIVRLPYRLLGSADMAFKTIATRQTLNQLAFREAIDKGLTESFDIAAYMKKRLDDPTPEMMEAALKNADYQTFQKDLGKLGNMIVGASNAVPELGFIVPFVRTPANILKYAGERTPLAAANLLIPFSKEMKANLSGINGEIARDTQIARMAVGTGIMAYTAMLAKDGLITGGGPKDPQDRARWLLTHKPYAVMTPFGEWMGYNRFEPFGTVMGISADMATMSQYMNDEQQNTLTSLLFASVTKNLVSKTWLQGPADLIEAIQGQENYRESYAGRFVSGLLVPNLFKQANSYSDPYLRDAQGFMETVQSTIPPWLITHSIFFGSSDSLQKKVDIAGNPITRNGIFSTAKNDPFMGILDKVDYSPSPVRREINTVKLTDEQYFNYATKAGVLARKAVVELSKKPYFNKESKETQKALVRKAISDAREGARAIMKERYPNLNKKAAKNRQTVYMPMREGE